MSNPSPGAAAAAALLGSSDITILVGAGLSAPPPTCLPGWWSLNDAVLAALGKAVSTKTNRNLTPDAFAGVVRERRDTTPFLKPDLQAQLIEDEIGAAYFNALAEVDSERPNAAHGLLAELSRLGHVGAIVTTNFDCVIERALDAANVPYALLESTEDFERLAEASGALKVIKVHGSATRPETMVDTLRQRLCGRPAALESWMHERFVNRPTIGLGFSCEDLEYRPDYLTIRPALQAGAKMLFLVREGSEPSKPLAGLVADFPDSAVICHGTLPDWLFAAATEAGIPYEAPAPASFSDEEVSTIRKAELEKLETALADWADSLSRMEAVNAVTALLASAGHREYADYMLERMWNFDREPDDCTGKTYARYLYNYGETLFRRGQFHNPHDREKDFGAWKRAADVDPRVFFFRALHVDHSDDALARSLLCFYLAGCDVPALGSDYTELWERLAKLGERGEPMTTAQIEATFALTELSELLGLAQATPYLHEAAHDSAVRIGDEFRRAEAAWRWARALAYNPEDSPGLRDKIMALTDECVEIAGRLDIRESDAGAALARSIASTARFQWGESRAGALAAEEIYGKLEDEWGKFLARRERLRALTGSGLATGTITAADFDELSEGLQRFSRERAPGVRPLIKYEIALAASIFDDKLAIACANDARDEARLQSHPVIPDMAEKLLASLSAQ
jgi:hypothetical protein